MGTTPEPTSVEAQLAVINTKLDLLIAGKDDHEVRLRSLEQFRFRSAGMAALIGTGSGAVLAAALTKLFA